MDNNFNGKKPSSQFANIIGISILIVFFGSIAGMLYFKDKNPTMLAFLFGLIFFWIGTGMVIITGMKKEALFPLLFSFIGAVVMTLSGAYMWGSEEIKSNIMQVVPILMLATLMIAGAVMILATYFNHRAKMQRCTEIITAVCIRLNERLSHSDHHTTTVYAPVYNYYYDGQEYTVDETTYSNVGVPEVGSEVEIRINPQQPDDCYRPMARSRVILYVMGTVFIVMPAICFVLYIKQMK